MLCQLAQFDIFLVSAETANRHRAPKPYVFALKSRLPRAHFEDSAQWCHLVSTKTPEEAASWVKTVIEAGVSFTSTRRDTPRSFEPDENDLRRRTRSPGSAKRRCSVHLPPLRSPRLSSTPLSKASRSAQMPCVHLRPSFRRRHFLAHPWARLDSRVDPHRLPSPDVRKRSPFPSVPR